MNVLGIARGPRKGGNTEILVQEALAGARDSGAKTDLLTVRDKTLGWLPIMLENRQMSHNG